ncbi:MAG: hypothetical protein IT340_02280 [Chloroflexi bacterium]|nr:hypothetical protein [Chloroflexota bacterium]
MTQPYRPDSRRPALARSLGCLLAMTLGLVGLFGLLALLLVLRLMPFVGP